MELRRLGARIGAWPPVAGLQRVLARYDAAGGGLLANGLAYAGLFALVPGVLLSAGLAGMVIGDPARRAEVVALVIAVLPPLRDLVGVVLDEVARGAAPVSILGAIALVWGASRMAVAFDDAIARVVGGQRHRGILKRNLVAVAAVLLLVGTLLGSTLLAGAGLFLDAARASGALPVLGDLVPPLLELLPVVAIVAAMVVVYRLLPIPRPAWRSVLLPGVSAGLVVAALAKVFVFVAPRLVGSAALLGTIATVFVALAWLSLSFQAILIGAAWVGDRMERSARRLGPPPA